MAASMAWTHAWTELGQFLTVGHPQPPQSSLCFLLKILKITNLRECLNEPGKLT